MDATFTAKSINPNPLLALDMRDIDEELAEMDETFRVVQDHLKATGNKRLIHLHQSEKTLIRHAVVLDHPYLDGENDKYRSTATEVHDVRVPVKTVKEQEARFEKRKAFYNRSKIHYVTELDKQTHEKMAIMQMGWIETMAMFRDGNAPSPKDKITVEDKAMAKKITNADIKIFYSSAWAGGINYLQGPRSTAELSNDFSIISFSERQQRMSR